jgi:hypothetical protein
MTKLMIEDDSGWVSFLMGLLEGRSICFYNGHCQHLSNDGHVIRVRIICLVEAIMMIYVIGRKNLQIHPPKTD